MAKLKRISPIIPVSDIFRSVDFFESVLGFGAIEKSESHALVERDNVNLHLQLAGKNAGQLSCYIDVEGIDSLYEEMELELKKLPPGRVRVPFNQEYGKREFHVLDLDSLLIFFGESIK